MPESLKVAQTNPNSEIEKYFHFHYQGVDEFCPDGRDARPGCLTDRTR